MTGLPPIFFIEHGSRERSGPTSQRRLPEGLFSSSFFPVVGKDRLVAGKESSHQDQIPIVVEAYSHNSESLRRVLLRQFGQHLIFVPARLAPRRPKIDQERFPAVLLHKLLVALRVDEFGVSRRCAVGGLRPGGRCQRGQHHKYSNYSPF